MISQLPLNGRILKGCKLPTLSQKKKKLKLSNSYWRYYIKQLWSSHGKKSQNPGGFMSKLQNCKQEINFLKDKSWERIIPNSLYVVSITDAKSWQSHYRKT